MCWHCAGVQALVTLLSARWLALHDCCVHARVHACVCVNPTEIQMKSPTRVRYGCQCLKCAASFSLQAGKSCLSRHSLNVVQQCSVCLARCPCRRDSNALSTNVPPQALMLCCQQQQQQSCIHARTHCACPHYLKKLQLESCPSRAKMNAMPFGHDRIAARAMTTWQYSISLGRTGSGLISDLRQM